MRVDSGGRYPVLRALAIINLFFAIVVAVVGVVAAIWAAVGASQILWLFDPPGMVGSRVVVVASILGLTFFAAVSVLAISELIELFMDMATSMRAMARPGKAPASADDGHADESAELSLLRGR